MFDSLEEQIKHDEQAAVPTKERILRWSAVIVVTLALFVGLYVAVQNLG